MRPILAGGGIQLDADLWDDFEIISPRIYQWSFLVPLTGGIGSI